MTRCCQPSVRTRERLSGRVRWSLIAHEQRYRPWRLPGSRVSPLFRLRCYSRRRVFFLLSSDGFLRHHARDLRAMESIVQTSGLAWTIARPPRLTKSNEASFSRASGRAAAWTGNVVPVGGGLHAGRGRAQVPCGGNCGLGERGMSGLFVPTLVLHVLVAVLGLGSIASVAIIAATARRSRRGAKEIFPRGWARCFATRR